MPANTNLLHSVNFKIIVIFTKNYFWTKISYKL